jgi:hypothetical protein
MAASQADFVFVRGDSQLRAKRKLFVGECSQKILTPFDE